MYKMSPQVNFVYILINVIFLKRSLYSTSENDESIKKENELWTNSNSLMHNTDFQRQSFADIAKLPSQNVNNATAKIFRFTCRKL